MDISYTQAGEYLLPGLLLSTPANSITQPLGKYAKMHRAYLREHRPALYAELLLSEKLYPLLWEIDETAARRLAVAGEANRRQAEEQVLRELVYG